MAEQKSAENIVFLPWTVEPQPQTQAVILQQPSETHLRLDATTDKTAIASFVAATVVGIIAAIWYGQKSFDLTKKSFDAVIKQIESSEKLISNSNQKLIEAQNNLKIKELNMIYRAQELAELRRKIQNYVSQGIRVRYFYSQSHAYSENSIFLEKDRSIFKKELRAAKIEFEVATYNLFTYLDHFNELHGNIHLQMLDILSIVALMVENEQDKSIYDENTKKFISRFQKLQAILKTLLQIEAAHNKGESISL